MKRIIFLSGLLLVFITFHIKTTAQYSWKWAITGCGAGTEVIQSIDCDSEGNIYATGIFDDTTNFFGETIISAGDHDVFVASFKSDGTLNWVRHGGGPYEEIPLDIYTDDQSVYVTGGFYDEASFENETLFSMAGMDMFLLKYDLAGNLKWALSGGSLSDDKGHAIAADESGNIYLTGEIRNTGFFGNLTVPYFGFTDIFIVKYNANGIPQWANSAGGPIWDYVGAIELKNDHLFIAGGFNDVAVFDTASVTSIDYNDIYIAHYMTDGSFVEIATAGGMHNDVIHCMALDSDMNVYVGGYFMENITLGNDFYTSNGSMDIFLAKYEPGNSFIWSKHYGGAGIDEADGMFYDVNGNLIFSINFQETITIGTYQMVSEGYDDAGLIKCNINGDVECACQIGGSGGLSLRGCTGDQDGNYYAAGEFLGEIRIGDHIFNPIGTHDLFLAQLGEVSGIGEEMDDRSPVLNIFPNPTSGNASIKYLMNEQRNLIIDLFEISGRKIGRFMNEEKVQGEYELEVDVSDLPAGVYFIRMQAGKETVVKKLIVK